MKYKIKIYEFTGKKQKIVGQNGYNGPVLNSEHLQYQKVKGLLWLFIIPRFLLLYSLVLLTRWAALLLFSSSSFTILIGNSFNCVIYFRLKLKSQNDCIFRCTAIRFVTLPTNCIGINKTNVTTFIFLNKSATTTKQRSIALF